MDRDVVFWKAVETARELLVQAEILRKSLFHAQADKSVYKACFLLTAALKEKGALKAIPDKLKELFKAFVDTQHPYEQLDLIQKIKDFE